MITNKEIMSITYNLPSKLDSENKKIIKGKDLLLYDVKSKSHELLQKNHLKEYSISFNKIENGLEKGDFIMYYQPKVKSDGSIVGFESLVRWNYEGKGNIISPNDFISFMENNNLISKLGNYTLRKTCNDIALLSNKGINPGIISINISCLQLSEDSFLDDIKNILKETLCSPKMLEFEIIETHQILDKDKCREKINYLKNIGIKISVDDFGTGFSNFERAEVILANTIKIDQSLIKNLEHSKSSRDRLYDILEKSKKMGINIIIEGVETIGQKIILEELGYDLFQGYLMGKPVDIKEVVNMLKKK